MLIVTRLPTKADRKHGRAFCAKCGEPAYRIWGEKPNAHPLCSTHNDEYIDAILQLLESDEHIRS